jgi:hypothetical protein
MAHANALLITALRNTAQRLRDGSPYSWGHHGQCNCGNLAQTVMPLNDSEIRTLAQHGDGEWTELANDYCGISGGPVEALVRRLTDLGLTPTDIHHLEYLNDRRVLQYLPDGFRWLRRNQRADAILYFEAFADMLEDQLLDKAVEKGMEDVKAFAEKPLGYRIAEVL